MEEYTCGFGDVVHESSKELGDCPPRTPVPRDGAPVHAFNRFFHWNESDISQMQLDKARTETKMKQLETERVKKDQLLTGKSESFVKQFKERMSMSESEDPRVFSSNIDLLAEDVASAMKERRRLAVVVYSHQGANPGSTAAEKLMVSVLSSLRGTINMAARQHEMRIENDAKAAERRRLITFAEEQHQPERPEVDELASSVSAQRRGTKGRQSMIRKTDSKRSVKITGGVSFPERPPQHKGGKRMSLMQRQAPPQDPSNAAMSKILPAPQLDKAPDPLRKTTLLEEEGDAGVSAQPPEQLAPLQTKTSRRSLSRQSTGSICAKRASVANGMTTLSRNGKKGILSCVHFNGSTACVKLPQLEGLAAWVNSCEIDFWLKTDVKDKPMSVLWIGDSATAVATLKITVNENEKQEPVPGMTCFYVRDQSSNVFSATTHEYLTTGKWRHICFSLKSLQTNEVDLFVDGNFCRMSIKTAEGPHHFPTWEQTGFLGVEAHGLYGSTPGQAPEKHLLGAMLDFRIASFEPKSTLRSHWELTEPPANENDDFSSRSAVPEKIGGANGEMEHPEYKLEEFPQTTLRFNGETTNVNLGTLSAFGEMMGMHSKVEMWMCSDCSDRAMSLIHVTDTAQKHAQIGMDLNVTVTGAVQRGSCVFTLRDAAGTELVASQNTHDLCDGKWHEVVWEIHRCNTMKLRIDGFNVDLDYSTDPKSDGPSAFIPLTQWLCLGAHNNRGVVQNHFKGLIRNVKISCADFEAPLSGATMLICDLPVDEGAGSTLLMDRTGHGNNGVIYDKNSKKKWATWTYTLLPEALQPDTLLEAFDAGSFESSQVEMTAVVVTQATNAAGLFQEKVLDLTDGVSAVSLEPLSVDIHKKALPKAKKGVKEKEPSSGELFALSPNTTSATSANASEADVSVAPDRRVTVKTIPKSSFLNVSSHDIGLQIFDTCLTHSKSPDHKHGSVVYTVKIGDGLLEVYDLKGFCPRTRSVWNSATDEWVEPLNQMNAEEKQIFFANKKARATERSLQRFGRSPTLFKNARRRLKDIAFCDTLVGTLLEGTLASHPDTLLYFLCVDTSQVGEDERHAAKSFIAGQMEATQHNAAIVIQKAARLWIACRRATEASRQKEEMLRHREYIRDLRANSQEVVCIRDKKIALIIDATSPVDPRLPGLPHLTPKCDKLSRTLLSQGWEVKTLMGHGCNVQALQHELQKVKTHVESKSVTVLVYFVGYGVKGRPYHAWLSRAEISDLLSNNELKGRHTVGLAEEQDRRIIVTEEEEEHAVAQAAEDARLEEERRVKEAEEKKNRKSKGGGDWVRVVKTEPVVEQPPIMSPSKRERPRPSVDELDETRRRLAEELREKTPLPFEPSPTPDISHIPPTPQWSNEKRDYLVLAATPSEFTESNTVTLEALTSALQRVELGVQLVVAGECHGAPGTDSDGFAFLQSSTGESFEWRGDNAALFFGHYARKCFTGCWGAVATNRLVKSAARCERDRETLSMYNQAREDALEHGAPLPLNPLSEKGVTWESFRDYILKRMRKRSMPLISCKVATPSQKPEYIGDVLLADFVPSLDKTQLNHSASGGVLSVSFAETATDDKHSQSLRDVIMELLNASFDGVKPRPFNKKTASVVLTFEDHISRAQPPYMWEADWTRYINTITGGLAPDVKYAVRHSDNSAGFLLEMWCEDPQKSRDLIDEFSVKYRGQVKMELRPEVIPSDMVLIPCKFGMVRYFGFEGTYESVERIHKSFMSGFLTALVASGKLPARVVGFHPATQEQLHHMRTAHAAEVEQKKAEARRRLDNPTEEHAIRRKAVEEKRKSLKSGMY